MTTEPLFTLTDVLHTGPEVIVRRGVYLPNGQRIVAKLPIHSPPAPRVSARLQHEYAMLRHLAEAPHVVRAVAHEGAGHGPALLLEDLGGDVALATLLAQRRLSLREALHVANETVKVLAAVHARGVLHKDIKPDNLLVDAGLKRVTLIDFGCATWLTQDVQQAVAPEELIGTLAYIPPEQTGRMNRAIDQRSDLYSLGVMLYEMLVGTLPFAEADGALALIHSHIARVPVPPHERAAEVPVTVSRLVMKLLAKDAEDRYQGARGLQADLEECLQQLDRSGAVQPFALGGKDRRAELRLPQKLYGREEEIAKLLAVFERVRVSASELLLVSGAAGVGKSALVSEIHKAVARRDGFFVTGKFDQLHRNTPLGPLSEAFRALVRQLLAGSEGELQRWTHKLRKALGPNGKLVTDLIPELELVLGPQPRLTSVEAAAATIRFTMVMQSFVRAFAERERPLVIFLDDLQWADLASIKLLHAVLADKEGAHVMVVGAYRSEEVDAAHPLAVTREALIHEGVRCEELTLPPLSRGLVHQWLGDALDASRESVADLADQVFDKTLGSPFFVTQFVNALHTQKLLWFDEARWAFAWDIEAIKAANVADNVVGFMVGRLKQMSPQSQEVLSLAACIGHRFDLATLGVVAERLATGVTAYLWEALRAGLILPLDADYRFVHVTEGQRGAAGKVALSVSYRFLHDRVQQAAYALIGEAEREGVHLRIGRLLRARLRGDESTSQLFDVAHHLNIGMAGIASRDERVALARLNLTTGRLAKTTTAYAAAESHFAAGIKALDEASWEREYSLRFELEVERAHCTHLTGAFAEADERFERILRHARSKADLARLYSHRIGLCMSRGQFAAGTGFAREALAMFGVDLPSTPDEIDAAFAEGIADIDRRLSQRTTDSLIHAPLLTDPDELLVQKLLIASTFAALTGNPPLGHVIILKQLSLCLSHGNTEMSAQSYCWAGVVLNVRLGRCRDAYRLGQIALALLQKLPESPIAAQVRMVFAMCIGPYCEPIPDLFTHLETGIEAGLRMGDSVGVATSAVNIAYLLFSRGEDLDAVATATLRASALVQRTNDAYAGMRLTALRQGVLSLQGKTLALGSMDGDGFDEVSWRDRIARDRMPRFNTSAMLLIIRFLAGDDERAQVEAEIAEDALLEASGSTLATEIQFYAALTLCARHASMTAEQQEVARKALARHLERHAVWAEHCEVNYGHRHALLEAEAARIHGHGLLALDEYERAIVLAQKHGCFMIEALANELCARFHLSAGRFRAARSSMREAREGYRRWGAKGKVDQLESRYPELLTDSAGEKLSVAALFSTIHSGASAKGTTGHASELIDAATILSAAQTVTSELVFDKMLERLMRVVLETAGAQRGLLLLLRKGQLVVEAARDVQDGAVSTRGAAMLTGGVDYASSIVEYVQRTMDPVVVREATSDGRFSADPYIVARRPRSILCLSMVHRNNLVAILYLENNLTTGVFTPSRLDLLGLFSTHAAVALENARLYAEVTAVSEELRRANANLEQEVQAQTQELRCANELLTLELSERHRIEEARAALQHEVIRMQTERLQELSAPLIPITRKIMVMPLIGTIDEERAREVVTVAMEGASRAAAAVVILDITGVKSVNAEVGSILLRTAGALGLLGTHVVITGIRPAIAQTLVATGFEQKALVIRGTLQDGIAYALGRTGEWMTASTSRLRCSRSG